MKWPRRVVVGACWTALSLTTSLPAQQTLLPKAPVYVEDSPAAQEIVQQAQELRGQERLTEAAAAYQKIIEQYPHKVLLRAPGLYADALNVVQERIAGDKALLEAYRRTHEAAALGELDRARGGEGLGNVVARYGLCGAGLEAGLRLAGMHLEAAAPVEAAAVLDALTNHPDLPGQAVRWHQLQAAAGLYADQNQRWREHEAALEELATRHAAGADESLAAVRAWRQTLKRPASMAVLSPWRTLPPATPPQPLGAPLWEVRLPMMATGAASVLPAEEWPGERVGRARISPESPPPSHVVPLADDQRLYVNDGEAIVAMDRSAGRVIWTYRHSEEMASEGAAMARRMSFARTGSAPESRSVLLTGHRVLAVVGTAMEGIMRLQLGAGGRSGLVCLDRDSGKVLWRLKPEDVDASLATAYFLGTPVDLGEGPTPGSGQPLFVLMRRSQMSGFQDSFVAAVAAEDGRVLWRRHLVSAVSGQRLLGRGLAQITVEQGRVYVMDHLGVVARLDGRSGTIQWLAMLEGAAETGADVEAMRLRQTMAGSANWQMSRPILTSAGLVVGPMRLGGPANLLDPQTGQRLRELRHAGWSQANYVTEAGDGILAVGPSLTLFDGQTLEPRWTRALVGATGGRVATLGRAAVTPEYAVIPTTEKLVTINLSDGTTRSESAVGMSGNVLAMDGQIIVSGGTAVQSYIEWERAYAQLREQIRANPGDPRPAMALAQVALSARQPDAVLEGVDQAIEASQRRSGPGSDASATDATAADAARDEEARAGEDEPRGRRKANKPATIFQQILGMTDPQRQATAELREALFDRMARATRGPGDEVAYHLALGTFLVEQNRPAQAVEHFQVVLSNPTLSAQVHQTESSSRQAGLEAQLRLRELVQKVGAEIYAPYEAAAKQRLGELLRQATPSAEALVELARQYPLASVAAQAQTTAAEVMVRQGQSAAAMNLLRQAYRRTDDAPLLGRIVGDLVELYAAAGQPRRARQWLQRAQREHPGLSLQRQGQTTDATRWLAELAAEPSQATARPELSLPLGHTQILEAQLLVPRKQNSASWPRDRFVTFSGARVQMRQASDGQVLWEAPAAAATQVLSLTDEQVLLWQARTNRLVALEARTGKPMWTTLEISAALDEVGNPHQRQAARPIEEQRFMEMIDGGPVVIRDGRLQMAGEEPDEAGPITAVGEMVVCIGDRAGRVIGVDRWTGQVLWRQLCPMDRLNRIELDEETAALSGTTGLRSDAQTESILLLDVLTGQARATPIYEEDTVRWMGLSGEGLLVYATATEVTAHHTHSGAVAWRVSVAGEAVAPRGRVGQDVVMLQTGDGAMAVIELSTGRLVRQVGSLGGGSRELLDLAAADGRWHVLSAGQATAVDETGQVAWQDAIAEMDKNLTVQLVGQRTLVLLSTTGRRPMGLAEVRQMMERRMIERRLGRRLPGMERNLEMAMEGPPADQEDQGKDWTYRLYVLDRESGMIQAEYPLGPLPGPIDATSVMLLDERVLAGVGRTTLVIRGAK